MSQLENNLSLSISRTSNQTLEYHLTNRLFDLYPTRTSAYNAMINQNFVYDQRLDSGFISRNWLLRFEFVIRMRIVEWDFNEMKAKQSRKRTRDYANDKYFRKLEC